MKVYRGNIFDYEQENRAFRLLCSMALTRLEDEAAIIGNVQGDGFQIDALVLRPHSITIVDFKEYGGSVRISEDEIWRTGDGVEIKGGRADRNPFHQVRRYKWRLKDRLKTTGLFPPPNDLGHISGLVMFTQAMDVDTSAMPAKAHKWFRAAAQDGAMDFLCDVMSRELNLSAGCMAEVAKHLGAEPFELQQSETWVPPTAVAAARQAAYMEAMEDLEYERQDRWWAENGEQIRADYEEMQRLEEFREKLRLVHRKP